MEVISEKQNLRSQIRSQKLLRKKIALVPTMGNLHEGHLSLINRAKKIADFVVVSIFVNPTQFLEGEDFERYPRTMEDDLSKLKKMGIDIVYTPELEDIYPHYPDEMVGVTLSGISNDLCGSIRPGHFDGVASVVLRLFILVEPNFSVFGNKDYQQKIVLENMVDDLSMPIKIIDGEIIREPDGLAMSSRNQYLTKDARLKAAHIFLILKKANEMLIKENKSIEYVENYGKTELEKNNFEVDYFSIRNKNNLLEPSEDADLIILASVSIEGVRLIDNIFVG